MILFLKMVFFFCLKIVFLRVFFFVRRRGCFFFLKRVVCFEEFFFSKKRGDFKVVFFFLNKRS